VALLDGGSDPIVPDLGGGPCLRRLSGWLGLLPGRHPRRAMLALPRGAGRTANHPAGPIGQRVAPMVGRLGARRSRVRRGRLRGKLDGSALCALDARTGAVQWQKFLENSAGETDEKGNLLNQAPSGGGQMAWYDGKLWWHGGEWGLAVVDPATGALRRAINYRVCDDFRYGMNEDLGILPGGWVTFGGWKPAHGVPAVLGSYQSPALFLRSGSEGLPADVVPHLLRLTADRNEIGSTRVSRQIPIWDERETLLPGDFTRDNKAPVLCRDAAAGSMPKIMLIP